MNIISRRSGYAHNLFLVILGPEDAGRSDMELITEADNRTGYKDMRVRHFGGEVTHFPGVGKTEIKVYTD